MNTNDNKPNAATLALTNSRPTDDEKQITLLRSEYNLMVDKYPDYMVNVWPRLPKRWTIGAVEVTGAAGSGLAHRLNYIRDWGNS